MKTPAGVRVEAAGRGQQRGVRMGRGARGWGAAALGLLAAALLPAPGAAAPPVDHAPRTVTVEARDLSTGSPVPRVEVRCTAASGATARAQTDASGTARVALTGADWSGHLNVRAARDGFVPLLIFRGPRPGGGPPPDRFVFRMERATAVGGRVLDQDGGPVAGATVSVVVRKRYPESEQQVDARDGTATTDRDGRWSFPGVPERPDAVRVGAFHHLYLTERSFYPVTGDAPLADLRAGTAVLVLRQGTRIDGTVVGPDGRPVPDASVFYGEGHGFPNSIPPVKADRDGRFALGIKPGTISILTARCPGFGPALGGIRVGARPQRVTLALTPPHLLAGQVVDAAGRPVARARLTVTGWRGTRSLREELVAGDDGRFRWRDAPDDEVRAQVYADGHVERDDVPLAPGDGNRVVLATPTSIRGTVVDAETGRPLPRFYLVYGAVQGDDGRVLWQRADGMDGEASKSPGSFEHQFAKPPGRYVVRVQAEGYRPEDSAAFSPDGSPRDFAFRLSRANPIRGVVLGPDGAPAAGGAIYLVPAGEALTLVNGEVPEYLREWAIRSGLSADGRFSLPPQNGACTLVALAGGGYAIAAQREPSAEVTLRLNPWARVRGRVRTGTRPAAGLEMNGAGVAGGELGGESGLLVRYQFTTDAEGRFTLPRVLPGRLEFFRLVPNGVRRITPVAMATLEAAAGRTHDLEIGGKGRPVTGRLALPANGPWMVRRAAIEPAAPRDGAHGYGVEVSVDGLVRADDVGPGDYTLRVSLHEPPPGESCGWGRLVGEYARGFTVPPVPGGVSDEPLDLGTLEPAPEHATAPRVGDVAPGFAAETLDGKPLSLADFKGKFVLLDFWATWCAPCVAEIPHLRAIHDRFAADPRFALVSLSLDEGPAVARSFVAARGLGWHQGFVGLDSAAVAAYGAAAIPATYLIGPDGKVLARGLKGEELEAAVAGALRP